MWECTHVVRSFFWHEAILITIYKIRSRGTIRFGIFTYCFINIQGIKNSLNNLSVPHALPTLPSLTLTLQHI